jgi:hypothetical protein
VAQVEKKKDLLACVDGLKTSDTGLALEWSTSTTSAGTPEGQNHSGELQLSGSSMLMSMLIENYLRSLLPNVNLNESETLNLSICQLVSILLLVDNVIGWWFSPLVLFGPLARYRRLCCTGYQSCSSVKAVKRSVGGSWLFVCFSCIVAAAAATAVR